MTTRGVSAAVGGLMALLLWLGCGGGGGDGAPECDAGLSRCGELCVALDRDPLHCGNCGITCGEAEVCSGGSCVCPEDLLACGEDCVDPETHAANCGGCGQACGEGETCVEGSCERVCDPPLLLCEGACIDPSTSEEHCGRCGEACELGASCIEGSCVSPCEQDEALCGGQCRKIQTDPANCGACGVMCDHEQTCVAGACVCPEGTEMCEGACIDTSSDLDHCGSCSNFCPHREGYAASCTEGSCTYECLGGKLDCDEGAAVACAVDPWTDPSHCGACGNDCTQKPGVATAICQYATCVVATCEEGRGDCDQLADNGCETDLLNSVHHCGGCFVSCADLPNNAAPPACNDGVCALECFEHTLDCDGNPQNGCEVAVWELETDSSNCGACGNACVEYASCIAGVCTPDPEIVSWSLPPARNHTAFEVSGDGTIVTDRITKLQWERALAPEMDFEAAVQRCEDLVLGGHDDWRLPTYAELSTLIDYGRTHPATNTLAFEGMPSDPPLWTSTPIRPDQLDRVWMIRFGIGIPHQSALTMTYRSRCVRQGPFENLPRYERGEDWIYDRVTDLTWEVDIGGLFPGTYAEAKSRCEAKGPGWRLPGIRELESIVNRTIHAPVIDEARFGTTQPVFYWSDTESYVPSFRVNVHFEDGRRGDRDEKLAKDLSRCVFSGRLDGTP